jgi:hypothetical protein
MIEAILIKPQELGLDIQEELVYIVPERATDDQRRSGHTTPTT